MPTIDSFLSELVAGQVSALDQALLTSCPVAVVPAKNSFIALNAPGRRLLLAKDGIYLEGRSHVLSCRFRIAECALPFGSITPDVSLLGEPLARSVFDQLAEMAIAAHPKEMAALVVRDADGSDRVHVPTQRGVVGQVSYDDAQVDEMRLVFDVHSHGPFANTFSSTDDLSDRSRIGPHISLLFGFCESRLSLRFDARICMGAHLPSVSVSALGALFDPNPTRPLGD